MYVQYAYIHTHTHNTYTHTDTRRNKRATKITRKDRNGSTICLQSLLMSIQQLRSYTTDQSMI